MDNQSLRGFLEMVETRYPDELLRVRAEVDTQFETTSMLFELDRAGAARSSCSRTSRART
jgi:2,5-furandicarboxylate decarboxylase 1